MNFFNFIKKYGLLDELDLGQIPSREFDDEHFSFLAENGVVSNMDYDNMPEQFKNHFLLYGLENNYEDTMVFITNNLITDVVIRPDGFYVHLRDGDDLEILFCEDRGGGGARYVAKLILSEDGLGHDWYYDNSVTPHQVVDELDDKNITTLKDIIFKEIGDVELSLDDYDSDFFSELSEEQGTEGYFRIRSEDLNGLVDDERAFNELCKNDLDELGSNLRSLYWQSENSAYEDEVYDLVYGGLEEYFEGRISEVPREVTRTDGSKVTRYDSYIKIRNFHNIIDIFLENNKGGYWSDSFLEYFGGLISLMTSMMHNDDIECIDFRVPDYPDWDRTRRNINELFYDYI
jgi:PKD repeat protein